MRKRHWLLTLVLGLALAGCSNDGGDGTVDVTDDDVVVDPDDLVGYRASLYPSHVPSERTNLNGTNTLLDVGLPRDATLDDVVVETIEMPFPVILYTREIDEIFVMGGTPLALDRYASLVDGLPMGENATAPYFAKFVPSTGEITYLDLDRGEGLPYVGGAVIHADGYVYAVSQAHLYRIEPEAMVIEASVALPTDGPATVYNGLITGRTGELILKSLSFLTGATTLSLIDGETLETVFSTPCDCASARIALALDGDGLEHLYHLNREQTFRYVVEPGSLTLDETWVARFDPDGTGINEEPTSPVIFDGRVHYTTNTNLDAATPMRVFWQDVDAVYTPDMPPLTGPLMFDDGPDDLAGASFGGLAADELTGILIGNDQVRGLVNAFVTRDDGSIDVLWQREFNHSSANTVVSDRQVLYVTDFVDGSNHLVMLDLMTGDELLRIPTPATRASIGSVICTPGGDVYMAANESGQPTGFLVRIHVP